MNKRTLIEEMRRAAGGGFISRKWLAEYMQLKDPKSVDCILHGLPRINSRYFVNDVAERMIEKCNYKEVR